MFLVFWNLSCCFFFFVILTKKAKQNEAYILMFPLLYVSPGKSFFTACDTELRKLLRKNSSRFALHSHQSSKIFTGRLVYTTWFILHGLVYTTWFLLHGLCTNVVAYWLDKKSTLVSPLSTPPPPPPPPPPGVSGNKAINVLETCEHKEDKTGNTGTKARFRELKTPRSKKYSRGTWEHKGNLLGTRENGLPPSLLRGAHL